MSRRRNQSSRFLAATGLWTALRITCLDPSVDVMLIEADFSPNPLAPDPWALAEPAP